MKKHYRKYDKSNTNYASIEAELQRIEEKLNIEITAELERSASGIIPVIKINPRP